jgi:phytanoyl-CoA hydroxylase
MIQDKDAQFYKENGYLLVQGVFNKQEIERMRAAVNGIIARSAGTKYERNTAWAGDYLAQDELKKLVLRGYHDVQYHDSAFMHALAHPNMVDILTKLIGPNVQLHHSKMLVKPPENGAAFPMHQDYPYFPHDNHTMLAASVHLDDADDENGCLRVIPGSHKQGPLPHVGKFYLDAKEYPIESGTLCPAKAGDVLFFNYLTIHGSKPNRSERIRRNVLFQYRDPEDPMTVERHINWGQGLMISGVNPNYLQFREKFQQQ